MYSYTNKQGEKVKVTEDHLMTAVKIKLELQKASPSRRCSWARLVKMMEEEGYDDAENSENYRVLIKYYQKQIGELPEADKHADMVADGKLQSIKNMIGELGYAKRDAQNHFRQINKAKREVIDKTLMIESIDEAVRSHDFSTYKDLHYKEIKPSSKKMAMFLSDLHVGAVVESEKNVYNFKVLNKTIGDYVGKVIKIAKDNNITGINLILLGDAIEQNYMHNLAYNCEFTLSEQIIKASDIIIKVIMTLVNADLNVYYTGIAGNHDRMNANKNDSLHGDHAVKGINAMVESFIENAQVKNATFIKPNDDYEHSLTLNGRNIICVHGDLDNITDKKLIGKLSANNNINYDVVVSGHIHRFSVLEVGADKYQVSFGSTKGTDGFGERMRSHSNPSQGIIMVDEDGDIDIRKISLK